MLCFIFTVIKGRKIIEKIDEHFMRHHGHAKRHGHDELDTILEAKKRSSLESLAIY